MENNKIITSITFISSHVNEHFNKWHISVIFNFVLKFIIPCQNDCQS